MTINLLTKNKKKTYNDLCAIKRALNEPKKIREINFYCSAEIYVSKCKWFGCYAFYLEKFITFIGRGNLLNGKNDMINNLYN